MPMMMPKEVTAADGYSWGTPTAIDTPGRSPIIMDTDGDALADAGKPPIYMGAILSRVCWIFFYFALYTLCEINLWTHTAIFANTGKRIEAKIIQTEFLISTASKRGPEALRRKEKRPQK